MLHFSPFPDRNNRFRQWLLIAAPIFGNYEETGFSSRDLPESGGEVGRPIGNLRDAIPHIISRFRNRHLWGRTDPEE